MDWDITFFDFLHNESVHFEIRQSNFCKGKLFVNFLPQKFNKKIDCRIFWSNLLETKFDHRILTLKKTIFIQIKIAHYFGQKINVKTHVVVFQSMT